MLSPEEKIGYVEFAGEKCEEVRNIVRATLLTLRDTMAENGNEERDINAFIASVAIVFEMCVKDWTEEAKKRGCGR